ncbi:hypothetical protein Y032_0085g1864 [Ancylostoma ceylanicum]|uniref:Uncharacterized protein n=1 Tax=Ancylostoma ceylanicum TaxID=53326 RepID=A0A016TQK3_9BILA|nr:hypothetical protein Y032_0085g1864 [Ancylostoma ceylanicum]
MCDLLVFFLYDDNTYVTTVHTDHAGYRVNENNLFQTNNSEEQYSTKSSGFSLSLEQGQNVAFTNWALHISDDGSVAVIVHELNANLKNYL